MNKVINNSIIILSKEIDRIYILEMVKKISNNANLGENIRKYVEVLETSINEQANTCK